MVNDYFPFVIFHFSFVIVPKPSARTEVISVCNSSVDEPTGGRMLAACITMTPDKWKMENGKS
jgi:hypothetical protein